MKDISPALRLCLAALFAVLFVLAAIAYLPHISGWIALILVALLLPIPSWQRRLERGYKAVKPFVIVALAVAVFMIAPVNRNHLPTSDTPTTPTVVTQIVTTTVRTTTRTTIEQPLTYILNQSSKKYHLPTCGSVKQMKEENLLTYTGLESELLADGYTPCGNCLP